MSSCPGWRGCFYSLIGTGVNFIVGTNNTQDIMPNYHKEGALVAPDNQLAANGLKMTCANALSET